MPVPSITVGSGPDLLALTPYLTGEPPADTVAMLMFSGDPRQVVSATYPLAPGFAPPELLQLLHQAIARVRPRWMAIAAYGPLTTRPALHQLIAHASRRVTVKGAFLAAGGRSYCLTCRCPEADGGVPFDPATTAAACQATFAGLAAPPPVRDPATPDPRRQARTAAALTATRMPANPAAAYRELIDALADGVPVTPARVARLAVVLTDPEVRDLALREVLRWPSPLSMWLDIVGHLPDAYLATSGDLAGIAAWKAEDLKLAEALFARVLAVHPGDRMADALAQAVRRGFTFRDTVSALFGEPGDGLR